MITKQHGITVLNVQKTLREREDPKYRHLQHNWMLISCFIYNFPIDGLVLSKTTYMESSIDGLSKPDMLLLLALACPPILLGNTARLGIDARFTRFHITENFDGIQGTALVRVNPIVTCQLRNSNQIPSCYCPPAFASWFHQAPPGHGQHAHQKLRPRTSKWQIRIY